MSFNAKELSKLGLEESILLKETKFILDSDNALFLRLRDDYLALDQDSNQYEKAFLSLINAILTQKRMYFALTRRAMQTLIKEDRNFKTTQEGFSNSAWPAILAKFYNQFKIIRCIKQGTTRTASIFEVIHPEIVEHLSSMIDVESQKEAALKFNQNTV